MGRKRKSWKKVFRLQNGVGFWDYKSGQEGLQIGEVLGISNRCKKIANRGRDFKLGEKHFKSGQWLQIEARGITNRVGITNRCRTYLLQTLWIKITDIIKNLKGEKNAQKTTTKMITNEKQ